MKGFLGKIPRRIVLINNGNLHAKRSRESIDVEYEYQIGLSHVPMEAATNFDDAKEI
jgi:hypothetical protein